MTSPNYTKQYLAQAAKDQKELQHLVPKIPKLNGFIGEWKEEHYWFDGKNRLIKKYVLSNMKDEITFTFNPGGDGSTSFNTERGWRSFDRTGVESSFYWKPWDYKGAEPVDLNEVLKDQLERIAKQRDYFKTAIKIPEIGFTISPDGLAKLKGDLKRIGYRRFMPSGFGTGYTISIKKLRFGNRVSKELEEFIGISPLYVETFDAD